MIAERFFRALAYHIRSKERLVIHKIRGNPKAWFAKIISADSIRFTETPVARGMAVGMFWAFVPMPFQMAPAFFFCWLARANIPVAMVCVWISNPFTYLPIFSAQYQIGAWLFGGKNGGWENLRELAAAGEIWALLKAAGPVFYQGAFLTCIVMSAAGYAAGRIMFYYTHKRTRKRRLFLISRRALRKNPPRKHGAHPH